MPTTTATAQLATAKCSSGPLPSAPPYIMNDFETGAGGTTVTTANSAAAGFQRDTAFSEVDMTGTCTAQYSNALAAHGSLSAKFVTGTGTANRTCRVWLPYSGSPAATLYFRTYVYMTAYPSASESVIAPVVSATAIGRVQVTATGKVTLQNTAGTIEVTTANSVPLNTWARLEGFYTSSATAGQASISLYKGDSLVPVETKTTPASLNTTGGNITACLFGAFDGTQSSAFTVYHDDVAVSSLGPVGPAAPPVASVTAFSGFASASGVSRNPVGTVKIKAGLASANGTAETPLPVIVFVAGRATVTGSAEDVPFSSAMNHPANLGQSAIPDTSFGGTIAVADFGATVTGWGMIQASVTLAEFNDGVLDLTITRNGSPYPLSGVTVNLLLKTIGGTPDNEALVLSSGGLSPQITITNAPGGLATVVIPAADLAGEPYRFYRVDVVVNGLTNTCIYGPVSWITL